MKYVIVMVMAAAMLFVPQPKPAKAEPIIGALVAGVIAYQIYKNNRKYKRRYYRNRRYYRKRRYYRGRTVRRRYRNSRRVSRGSRINRGRYRARSTARKQSRRYDNRSRPRNNVRNRVTKSNRSPAPVVKKDVPIIRKQAPDPYAPRIQ